MLRFGTEVFDFEIYDIGGGGGGGGVKTSLVSREQSNYYDQYKIDGGFLHLKIQGRKTPFYQWIIRAQGIIMIGPIMISRWALPSIPDNLLYTQLKKLFTSL